MKVLVVGLRSRTQRRRGASWFTIILVSGLLPTTAYQDTLLSPVVGFLAYYASHFEQQKLLKTRAQHTLSSRNFSKLELNTNGKTISIAFNISSSSREGNQMTKCAAFGALGDVFLSEVGLPTICYSTSQGHFSIVIPFERRMSMLWIVGFVAGLLGLILVGLVGIVAVRSLVCMTSQEMEKEVDDGEFLQSYLLFDSP